MDVKTSLWKFNKEHSIDKVLKYLPTCYLLITGQVVTKWKKPDS